MNEAQIELMKLYMNKVIEKGDLEVEKLVNKHLPKEERGLSLREFLGIWSDKKGMKTLEYYQNKFEIGLHEKVTHLYSVYTSQLPASKELARYTKSKGKNVSIVLSLLLTEDYEIILLKGHLYEKELAYFTFKLDFNQKNPPTEEVFIMEYLTEFLQIKSPEHRLELYAIKKDIYQQIKKYLTQYSSLNDLAIIKQGLQERNSQYEDLELEIAGKKTMKLKYGGQEKVVQFAECNLLPVSDDSDSYRTISRVLIKDDIDAMLVKAIEPGTNKSQFVFVSNVDYEIQRRMEDKRDRLNVSALFQKTNQGFNLKKELGRESLLKYMYIYDVEL